MKILVIGLGSMGRRRIRLIQTLNPTAHICGVDLSGARREQAQKELNLVCYDDLSTALNDFKPYCAFICTSPITHGEIALRCLSQAVHVFTEINLLSNWYDQACQLTRQHHVHLFLSSTFLYRKEIEYIRQAVQSIPVNYMYHTGQYLPDWHPWENYQNFFVANPKTNGCREIFAIELPWLIQNFGKVTHISVLKNKLSQLQVNYNDNYLVLLEHASGSKGVLGVDIISRKPVRHLEIYAENLHLFWDGTPAGLQRYNLTTKTLENIQLYRDINKDPRYASSIIENAYTEEIKEFFELINGLRTTSRYSIIEDKETLALIDKIEETNG